MDTQEVEQHIKDKKLVIDVRQKAELQYGMLPTAQHLPFEELEEAFSLDESEFKERYGFRKPTKEQTFVLYCRTGGRSSVATALLKRKGYHAENYDGSIYAWSETHDGVKRY